MTQRRQQQSRAAKQSIYYDPSDVESDDGSVSSLASTSNNPSIGEVIVDEVFNFDDQELVREYLDGYTVCRKPRLSESTMSYSTRQFLELMVQKAKVRFPTSNYVIVQDGQWLDNEICETKLFPQNQDAVEIRKKILPEMLKNGKLNACVLKGNKDTGCFYLVATEPLEQWTPIAIDCGVVWSDDCRSRWLEDQTLGTMACDGLSSFPASLFSPLFSYREWKNDVPTGAKSQSFVIDFSVSGNEVKHLTDASWIHSTDEAASYNPTVDALAILNLGELKEGQCPLSVVYCVNQKVNQGTMLSIDRGGWHKISTQILPRLVFMSNVVAQRLARIQASLSENNIPYPKEPVFNDGVAADYDHHKRNKVLLTYLPRDKALEYAKEDVSEFGTLSFLYHLIFGKDCGSQRPTKQVKKDLYRVVSDFESIGINPTLTNATRPTGPLEKKLSQRTRDILDELDPMQAHCGKVRAMIDSSILDYVQVREIMDTRNPAKLFAIPGQKVHGVFANRDFDAGDPVMCYAGYLMDNDLFKVDNAYMFDIQSDLYCKELPEMIISGEESIAGLINDAVSLGGTEIRNYNLVPVDTFDPATKNPMILLRATRKIHEGEELLYSYGEKFWKYIWKDLMQEHSKFIIKTEQHIKQLENLLDYDF